jgi:uracil-DNA glycosylase
VAKSHQSVNWAAYFFKIKEACPWSYAAWQKNKIDIVKSRGIIPLGEYAARVYVFDLTRRRLKKLCKQRDHGEYEWLWSVPGYGANGTPVTCLIQQSRSTLTRLRNKTGSDSS